MSTRDFHPLHPLFWHACDVAALQFGTNNDERDERGYLIFYILGILSLGIGNLYDLIYDLFNNLPHFPT